MALPERFLPRYSYRDYEAWEGRWELIRGIPFAMSPSPNLRHQKINTKLAWCFTESLQQFSNCIPVIPVDYRLDDHTILQPDLLVISDEADGQYLDDTPELVVEILSPSTADNDRELKYQLYQEEGVPYYLIVDPVTETIEVFHHQGTYELVATLHKESPAFEFRTRLCTFSGDFSKIW